MHKNNKEKEVEGGIEDQKGRQKASVMREWNTGCDIEGLLKYDKGIDRFRVLCLLMSIQ